MAGLMYLIDTNIWLEELLEQDRSEEVFGFFGRVPSGQLYLTDFSHHSIGVIFSRLGKMDSFAAFTTDVLLESAVNLVGLSPSEMALLPTLCKKYGFDFDDAYQYAIAEIHGLEIVSFDHDFDGTDLGRKEPRDIPA